MNLNTLLSIVIGLAFVYVILSVIVSQINVFISNVLNIRAEVLRVRLQHMLFYSDEGERIMKHPLVGIVADEHTSMLGDVKQQMGGLWTWLVVVVGFIYRVVARVAPKRLTDTVRINNIAPDSFAKAVVNVINNTDLERLHDMLAAAILTESDPQRQNDITQKQNILRLLKDSLQTEEPFNTLLNQFEETLPEMLLDEGNQHEAYRLINNLRDLNRYLVYQKNVMKDNAPPLEVALLQYGVSRIKSDPLRRALDSMLVGAKNLAQVEEAIEAWYNRKLDQTKDMYTRHMQNITLVTGLILVLVLNIDSIDIVRTLWTNPAARAAIEQQVETNLGALERSYEITMQAAQLSDDGASQEAIVDSLGVISDEIGANLDTALNLPIPFGWAYYEPAPEAPVDLTNAYYLNPFNGTGTWGHLAIKIGGLLLSVMSIAQGAPFWFDVLRMLTGRTSPSSLEDKLKSGTPIDAATATPATNN